MNNWELSFGFYPGIMLGFRTYNEVDKNNHVLYIPFVDACLTVYDEFIVPANEYVEDYLYTIGFPDEYESYYTELLKKGV